MPVEVLTFCEPMPNLGSSGERLLGHFTNGKIQLSLYQLGSLIECREARWRFRVPILHLPEWKQEGAEIGLKDCYGWFAPKAGLSIEVKVKGGGCFSSKESFILATLPAPPTKTLVTSIHAAKTKYAPPTSPLPPNTSTEPDSPDPSNPKFSVSTTPRNKPPTHPESKEDNIIRVARYSPEPIDSRPFGAGADDSGEENSLEQKLFVSVVHEPNHEHDGKLVERLPNSPSGETLMDRSEAPTIQLTKSLLQEISISVPNFSGGKRRMKFHILDGIPQVRIQNPKKIAWECVSSLFESYRSPDCNSELSRITRVSVARFAVRNMIDALLSDPHAFYNSRTEAKVEILQRLVLAAEEKDRFSETFLDISLLKKIVEAGKSRAEFEEWAKRLYVYGSFLIEPFICLIPGFPRENFRFVVEHMLTYTGAEHELELVLLLNCATGVVVREAVGKGDPLVRQMVMFWSESVCGLLGRASWSGYMRAIGWAEWAYQRGLLDLHSCTDVAERLDKVIRRTEDFPDEDRARIREKAQSVLRLIGANRVLKGEMKIVAEPDATPTRWDKDYEESERHGHK